MNELLVIAFPNGENAEQARATLLSMERENLMMQDAVIAAKMADGGIQLSQLANSGEFWGIRAAASGNPVPSAAGALTDFGINDKFVKGVAAAIPQGGAALFVLAGKIANAEVLERLRSLGGTVWRGPFDKSAVNAVRAALAAQLAHAGTG